MVPTHPSRWAHLEDTSLYEISTERNRQLSETASGSLTAELNHTSVVHYATWHLLTSMTLDRSPSSMCSNPLCCTGCAFVELRGHRRLHNRLDTVPTAHNHSYHTRNGSRRSRSRRYCGRCREPRTGCSNMDRRPSRDLAITGDRLDLTRFI